MAIRRRKKPSLVLPLSSMGDIAFLLIIFFMLASLTATQPWVDFFLPLQCRKMQLPLPLTPSTL